MKKIIHFAGIIFAFAAHATDNDRTIATSQHYVETQLAGRQNIVPTKTGDKAITNPVNPAQDGAIGERDIKTTLGNESNQSDTGITTVETVKTAVDNKQEKTQKLPENVNVMTYTGTNDDSYATDNRYGRGVTSTTPIYDENVNTYANGLVRAETLNTAVQTGVSRALTQVAAGFVINDIGNILPTTVYVTATDRPTNYCHKDIVGGDRIGSCSDTLFNSLVRGDWGLTYDHETGISYPNNTCTGTKCYKEVQGISACTDQTFTGAGYAVIAPNSLSSTLQTAYENSRDGSTPSGRRCYCRLVNPHVGVGTSTSPWVYRYDFDSAEHCARDCAGYCGYSSHAQNIKLRNAIFGGVNSD